MISRVAEHCFWLHRYMERAENTARLLRVNRAFVLDINLPALDRWLPVIVVSGEQRRFSELYSPEAAKDGELVQDYLTWQERNSVSMMSSLRCARDNARTIREVMSQDGWELINSLWHWLRGQNAQRLYRHDRDAFYQHIVGASDRFYGVCEHTMLNDEPFNFMQLGICLERAGQTARIVDVKHHIFGPTTPGRLESPAETAHWMALLRSCSATEAFFRSSRGLPSGRAVVEFLLMEEQFPRSVLFSLTRAQEFLKRIRSVTGGAGERSATMLDELAGRLRSHHHGLFDIGIHEELTWLIDSLAEVCNAVHDDYFDPSFEDVLPLPLGAQLQS